MQKFKLLPITVAVAASLASLSSFAADTDIEALEKRIQELESRVHFSALFTANDQTAYGAIKALHDHGYKVPEDVSVIGFDDLPTSKYFTPALTTLRQPIEEIGEVCAQSILNLLSGERHEARLPPIDLIVRESTKSLYR
ncbi:MULTISPECIES: substrate-binding domain-containing protein [unclassified Vibrio]|uniref:substrate-binding domain-containing protein n=1 Tax=unclassified Vibrio TaxID=2614977 RepID=UPI00352CA2C1